VYNTSRKDLLTSLTYNDGTSEAFSYDGLGNPTVYRGKILQWSNVNQLTNYNGNTFTYDGTGKRISKNGTTYFYAGDKLIKEIRPNNVTISYLYGLDGIIGFKYGEDYYFYQKNLQGDVIEIIARNGISVANYSYDAFGNHKVYNTDWTENTSSDFIGNINPIRYRGYYYDTETSLYFVQGRYYDPEFGRFINPDEIKNILPEIIEGLNLYLYCNNSSNKYKYLNSTLNLNQTVPISHHTLEINNDLIADCILVFAELVSLTSTALDIIQRVKIIQYCNLTTEICDYKWLEDNIGVKFGTASKFLVIFAGGIEGLAEWIATGNKERAISTIVYSAGTSLLAGAIGSVIGGFFAGPLGAIIGFSIAYDIERVFSDYQDQFVDWIDSLIDL